MLNKELENKYYFKAGKLRRKEYIGIYVGICFNISKNVIGFLLRQYDKNKWVAQNQYKQLPKSSYLFKCFR